MLKKPSIAAGVLIAAAAGAIGTSLPAFSQAPSWGGGCCSSSRSSFFHHNKNRNWNGTENESYNHIRLRIHNRNNNIAVARVPSSRDRLREIRFVPISP